MTLSYANSLLFCTKNCIHYNLHSLFIRQKKKIRELLIKVTLIVI